MGIDGEIRAVEIRVGGRAGACRACLGVRGKPAPGGSASPAQTSALGSLTAEAEDGYREPHTSPRSAPPASAPFVARRDRARQHMAYSSSPDLFRTSKTAITNPCPCSVSFWGQAAFLIHLAPAALTGDGLRRRCGWGGPRGAPAVSPVRHSPGSPPRLRSFLLQPRCLSSP